MWAALTRAEWEGLYHLQRGGCAICHKPLINRYAGQDSDDQQRAYCDHQHSVERALVKAGADPIEALRRSIRGLLCLWCNRHILVALHDNPEKAQRAADYLRNPPARQVVELPALKEAA